jgi:hypothetical protein
MQVVLNVTDEAMFGLTQPSYTLQLNFPQNHISVRELIETRVREEVENFNAKQPEIFNMLVQPTLAERVLNGFKLKEKKPIDWRDQYKKAVEAFERNGFIILVDDLQVEGLDQIIEIDAKTSVTFLKLVPLVGG